MSEKILSVDPAQVKVGISLLREETNRIKLLDSNQVYLIGKTTEERLAHLYQWLDEYVNLNKPSEIALEETFVAPYDNKKKEYKFNLDAPLKLSMARGVVYAIAGKYGIKVYEYSNGDVKKTATGDHHATKSMIIKKISEIFKKYLDDNNRKSFEEDEADSVAIGITHLITKRLKNDKS